MTTAELHALVKSVEAPDTVDSLSNGFYTLTVEEMLALCKKAQAQALRDAADLVQDDYGCDVDSAAKIRRMAKELERGA